MTLPPATILRGELAAELADFLRFLRDWIDVDDDHLDPLLTKHAANGYDIIGMRVDLDRFIAHLTPRSDSEVF